MDTSTALLTFLLAVSAFYCEQSPVIDVLSIVEKSNCTSLIPFLSAVMKNILLCARYCGMIPVCVAMDYKKTNHQCRMFHESCPSLVNDTENFHSNISSWPEQHQRFTKCTLCSNFKSLIDTEKDLEERRKLISLRDLHLTQQQLERESYYVRRAQAETRPKQILSLIIDGMDQKKTNLPHYANWTNPDGAGTYKLKTHVVWSLVHGRLKYFFVDYNQFPHDTNLVLTCLLTILGNMSAAQKNLPPTLYIQLDNTTRENKNKYFLGFAAYLVKKDIVRECWVPFLIVGHTHEDVDQTFSKISHRLKKNCALTLPSLLDQIKESQHTTGLGKSTHVVGNIDYVWDISGWLEEYVNQVHNVTYPHIYRLSKDGTDHVQVQFKQYSTDEYWRPQTGEKPLEIFKQDQSGKQRIPPGCPDLVVPAFKEDNFISQLERSLAKDFGLAAFRTDVIETWREFLLDPLPEIQEPPMWPLDEIDHYQEVTSTSSLTEKERTLITKFTEKQHQYKEVFTVQRNSWKK